MRLQLPVCERAVEYTGLYAFQIVGFIIKSGHRQCKRCYKVVKSYNIISKLIVSSLKQSQTISLLARRIP